MIRRAKLTEFRPASAWLRAFSGACCLALGLGAVNAADPGTIVEERGTGDNPPSLSVTNPVIVNQATVTPQAPEVTACPVVALVSDGNGSGNERGPNSNSLGGRAHWLITAAEASANGLLSGTTPGAIGFRYSTAPGATASGTLKVYLQNTADTTNLKSPTWTTAIVGMTLVHSAATTLPNTTSPFDITFSGGSPFTYTGGGLYVAFEWSWAGPVTSACVVACNVALTNGLKGVNSSTSTALTASSFRPETRLTPSVAVLNDASVDYVISLGSLPQSLVGPQTVQAVVTNKGANPLTNLPVTLNVTGAQAFTNTQVVAGPLAACGGQAIVTFAPFSLTALGSDTVTVSVPADDVATNNSKNRPLDSTSNLYSYKHPGTTAAGGVGVNAPNTADFVGKFTITAAAKISAVNLEFFATSATTYRVAIYPESSPGSGVPGLTPSYEDAADRTVGAAGPVTITLPTPLAVSAGTFFAGVEQTNTTNAAISFDNEVPIRSSAFYLAVPHPATAWFDFSPGNNFKLNLGVTLIQCTSAAECNDNNTCTDDACTNNLCTHVNNNLTECDGNACSSPDQCSNGTCIPGPNPCNDNNACTVDLCAAGGGCTYSPTNCDDGNPCTNDFCVPATGCAHSNNTAACSDGNPCTIGDTCSNGACVPGAIPLPPATQFCNNGTIVINDVAPATPYPASITVTGQPSYLCSMSVNLNNITHTFTADMDILLARLVGNNAIIMSDVGGTTGVSGVSLTLTDSAAVSLPAGTITSGTYKPTNIGAGDTFAAPAPAPTGGSALSAFTGTNPNGTWNLFVVDDVSGDTGTIGGWCVNLVAVCTVNSDCDDSNPCTDDTCNGGICSHTNNTNPCNDNNACTANDTCSNGVCVGGPPPPCDDGNACTANVCNTGTGLCENPPIVCNDNNSCTDDSCNPLTGCVYTPNDQNSCTDNSLCTSPDICQNGVCVGQNPVVCAPDANPCTTEACNPATGQCATTSNTNACDDGDVCTTGDVCGPNLVGTPYENFDGVTAPAFPAGWTTSANGSAIAWTTTSASSDSAPNSALGDDSNTGTGLTPGDEFLVSPVIPIISPTASVSFQNRWSFEGTTSCFDAGVLEISINGGAFADIVTAGGSFVTGGYTNTVSVSFSNPLAGRSAWCNASAGYPAYLTTTVNLPAAAAGQNIQLRWRVGIDTSAGAVGQNIDTITIADGYNTCQPGTGTLNCDDGNPCTDDYCDPQLGCQHANNNESCDDGNACTILDACNNGSCSGNAIVCNDFNVCTTDSCVPATGCVFANNTNACDDGNACTVGDACSGGVCVGGTPAPAPGEAQGVSAPNKTTISWSATAGATRYDVLRGSTGALPVGPGGGDEVCFDNLATPSLTDATVPTAGSGFWYLSRAENACGNGTYGTQGVHGVPGAARVSTTCP